VALLTVRALIKADALTALQGSPQLAYCRATVVCNSGAKRHRTGRVLLIGKSVSPMRRISRRWSQIPRQNIAHNMWRPVTNRGKGYLGVFNVEASPHRFWLSTYRLAWWGKVSHVTATPHVAGIKSNSEDGPKWNHRLKQLAEPVHSLPQSFRLVEPHEYFLEASHRKRPEFPS
jgi:hypothetical protein